MLGGHTLVVFAFDFLDTVKDGTHSTHAWCNKRGVDVQDQQHNDHKRADRMQGGNGATAKQARHLLMKDHKADVNRACDTHQAP